MNFKNIISIGLLVIFALATMMGCELDDDTVQEQHEGEIDLQSEEAANEATSQPGGVKTSAIDETISAEETTTSNHIASTPANHETKIISSSIEESQLVAFWVSLDIKEYRGLNLMEFDHLMSYAIGEIYYSGTWSFDSTNHQIVLNIERAKVDENELTDFPKSMVFDIVSFSDNNLSLKQEGEIFEFHKQ